MATFKLGAIITDIRGSIGGSTIRRVGNGHSIYNKQGSQIKSAFAQTSRKNALGNIFGAWYALSEEDQEQWRLNALSYTVKDKFGNNKYLTGRELFTKLNAQLLPANAVSDLNKFDIYVENAEVKINVFSVATEELNINWGGSFTEQYIFISIYQLRKKGKVKPHAHFRRQYARLVSSSTGIDIWDEFIKSYPLAHTGDRYGFNIQFVNICGIISSVQAFAVDLE